MSQLQVPDDITASLLIVTFFLQLHLQCKLFGHTHVYNVNLSSFFQLEYNVNLSFSQSCLQCVFTALKGFWLLPCVAIMFTM